MRFESKIASGKPEAGRVPFNSVVALAAAVSLCVGAFWWTITLRHEGVPAAITLADGLQRLDVGADGRVTQLRHLPEPLQDAVAVALRTGRLPIPAEVVALRRAIPPASRISAPQVPPLRVLRPVATYVREDQPHLHWRGQAGAAGYRVTIKARDRGAVVSSGDLPAPQTEWTPHEPLPKGETYEWEVEAFRDREVLAKSPAPAEGEARFLVLSPAQLAQFEELKRAAGNSHLALGVAAASTGLLDEAAADFYALAVQNPRSEIVRQLLEQLDANKR